MKEQTKTTLKQLAIVISMLGTIFGIFFGIMTLVVNKTVKPEPVVNIHQTISPGMGGGTNFHIDKTITVIHE